jgi:hypothetical protein
MVSPVWVNRTVAENQPSSLPLLIHKRLRYRYRMGQIHLSYRYLWYKVDNQHGLPRLGHPHSDRIPAPLPLNDLRQYALFPYLGYKVGNQHGLPGLGQPHSDRIPAPSLY